MNFYCPFNPPSRRKRKRDQTAASSFSFLVRPTAWLLSGGTTLFSGHFPHDAAPTFTNPSGSRSSPCSSPHFAAGLHFAKAYNAAVLSRRSRSSSLLSRGGSPHGDRSLSTRGGHGERGGGGGKKSSRRRRSARPRSVSSTASSVAVPADVASKGTDPEVGGYAATSAAGADSETDAKMNAEEDEDENDVVGNGASEDQQLLDHFGADSGAGPHDQEGSSALDLHEEITRKIVFPETVSLLERRSDGPQHRRSGPSHQAGPFGADDEQSDSEITPAPTPTSSFAGVDAAVGTAHERTSSRSAAGGKGKLLVLTHLKKVGNRGSLSLPGAVGAPPSLPPPALPVLDGVPFPRAEPGPAPAEPALPVPPKDPSSGSPPPVRPPGTASDSTGADPASSASTPEAAAAATAAVEHAGSGSNKNKVEVTSIKKVKGQHVQGNTEDNKAATPGDDAGDPKSAAAAAAAAIQAANPGKGPWKVQVISVKKVGHVTNEGQITPAAPAPAGATASPGGEAAANPQGPGGEVQESADVGGQEQTTAAPGGTPAGTATEAPGTPAGTGTATAAPPAGTGSSDNGAGSSGTTPAQSADEQELSTAAPGTPGAATGSSDNGAGSSGQTPAQSADGQEQSTAEPGGTTAGTGSPSTGPGPIGPGAGPDATAPWWWRHDHTRHHGDEHWRHWGSRWDHRDDDDGRPTPSYKTPRRHIINPRVGSRGRGEGTGPDKTWLSDNWFLVIGIGLAALTVLAIICAVAICCCGCCRCGPRIVSGGRPATPRGRAQQQQGQGGHRARPSAAHAEPQHGHVHASANSKSNGNGSGAAATGSSGDKIDTAFWHLLDEGGGRSKAADMPPSPPLASEDSSKPTSSSAHLKSATYTGEDRALQSSSGMGSGASKKQGVVPPPPAPQAFPHFQGKEIAEARSSSRASASSTRKSAAERRRMSRSRGSSREKTPGGGTSSGRVSSSRGRPSSSQKRGGAGGPKRKSVRSVKPRREESRDGVGRVSSGRGRETTTRASKKRGTSRSKTPSKKGAKGKAGSSKGPKRNKSKSDPRRTIESDSSGAIESDSGIEDDYSTGKDWVKRLTQK